MDSTQNLSLREKKQKLEEAIKLVKHFGGFLKFHFFSFA